MAVVEGPRDDLRGATARSGTLARSRRHPRTRGVSSREERASWLVRRVDLSEKHDGMGPDLAAMPPLAFDCPRRTPVPERLGIQRKACRWSAISSGCRPGTIEGVAFGSLGREDLLRTCGHRTAGEPPRRRDARILPSPLLPVRDQARSRVPVMGSRNLGPRARPGGLRERTPFNAKRRPHQPAFVDPLTPCGSAAKVRWLRSRISTPTEFSERGLGFNSFCAGKPWQHRHLAQGGPKGVENGGPFEAPGRRPRSSECARGTVLAPVSSSPRATKPPGAPFGLSPGGLRF